VDARTTKALSDLAKRTDDHGWWEDYSAIPDWFGLYVDLEAMAISVQIWDPELVHGLLQTPGYVRALFAANRPDLGNAAVDQRIRSRAERQQALHRENPLRLTAVFGAAVLQRQVGGKEAMADQLQRMRDLAALGHVDIRVLPWEVGPHAAMHTGAFTILSCPGDDPDVVYREGHTGAQYMEMPAELEAYRGIFAKVYDQSIPIREYAP
jgi:hypothetical protein